MYKGKCVIVLDDGSLYEVEFVYGKGMQISRLVIRLED
jgi:hypothetical protein